VGEVGLGAARKFSSASPLFAVIDNVPIIGRAAYEADWNFKKGQKGNSRRMQIDKSNGTSPKARSFEAVKIQSPVSKASIAVSEMDKYFPSVPSTVAQCVTFLVVPLSPPRQALGQDQPASLLDSIDGSRLLDFASLANTHSVHTTHRLRVSTLFSKLDVANVWGYEGVTCRPFSISDGAEDEHSGNQVTHLKITFPGWTAVKVQSVIGESGLGWCELSESTSPLPEDQSESIGLESPFSDTMDLDHSFNDHDLADTLVLPTIDFTARQPDHNSSEDWFSSEFSSSGSDDESDIFVVSPPSAPMHLGFSARFLTASSRSTSDDGWTSPGFSDFE
jgi:hypothetical protein